jgi:tetratricopeptide (TPR) repeat protein
VAARQKLDDYAGVAARIERVIETSRARDDKPRLARALSWMGNIHMLSGFPSLAVPYLGESKALAEHLDEEQLLLLPLFYSSTLLVDNDPTRAAEVFKDIADVARDQHVPELIGHALAYRAIALARIGSFDAAESAIREAFEAAPLGNSRIKEADVHIAAGAAFTDMGQLDKALQHARIGAEMAQAANGLECACAGYFGVGVAEQTRGDVESALAEYNRSLRIGQRFSSGWETFVNRIRGGVASAELARGEADKARDLESSLANARRAGDEFNAAELAEQLAIALTRLGRLDEADQHLEAALARYRATGMKTYVARALGALAELRERQGRADEARRIREDEALLRASFHAHPEPAVQPAG